MSGENTQPNTPPITTPNTQEIIQKGEQVYSEKKGELEPTYSGKYVVIEVESGEYFIGDTRDEAIANSRKKFPTTIVFVKRIGGVEKTSKHLSNSFRPKKYAQLL